MKFQYTLRCILAGMCLPVFTYGAIPGNNLLEFDFDKKNLPAETAYQLVTGHTGKGLFFAQENLKDFSGLGTSLKSQNSVTIPFKDFPASGGEYSFRYRPFFNQDQPYRSTKQAFKLYYLAQFSGKGGAPLTVYILGKNISAVFRFANGKTFSLTAPLADWKTGEWHQITIRWTPFVKEILLDGKQAGKLNLSGELSPTADALIVGGSGSDCSAQGVLDDLNLSSLEPEVREQFSTRAALEKSWELIRKDGAEGTVRIDPSVKTRSGAPSLQLVKTNNKGYLMLRLRKPLDLPVNTTYRIGGSFHSGNADVTNTLCFRVQENEDNPYYYHVTPNSGEVYTTYSLLTNSPAGKWTDSFYYITPRTSAKPPVRRIAVLLRGAPCSVNIDEVRAEAVAPHSNRPLHPDSNCHWDGHTPLEKPLLTESEVYEKMKKRPPARLSIRQNKRSPELLCNGKLMIPSAYRVQSWNKNCRYYEMQHLAGTDLLMVPVTAGGRGSVNIMKEVGKYDFTAAVEDFMRALRRAPDAVYLMQVSARPYPGMDADPDEIWQNRDGLFGVSNDSGMLYVNRFVAAKTGTQEYYPSYASRKWRKHCADAVAAYVRHLRSSGLLNAVGAFTIAIGEDGQFLTPLAKFDYSPVARRGFSEFLKKKYGTVEKLRAAWNDPTAVFEFPTPQSMPNPVMAPGDFRDPAKHQKSIDATEYHYSIQLDTMNYFAERIEEAAGRPMLFITSSWGGNLPYQDKIAERRSPLDGTSPQLRYPDRRPGRPIANQTALDSMRANGTIDFQELDLRTYTRRVMPDALYRDYHSYAMTPDEFRNVSRRMAGFQIAKSQGFWYYDMAQEFADPEILKIIKKGNEIFREVASKPDAWKPDVAVVYDLFSIKTLASGLSVRMEQWIAGSLLPSGVPYDMFYLSDFLKNKERQNYKTILFCSTLYLDAGGRRIIDSLKKDGRTLIFLYAPGYLSPSGASVEAMNHLAGISAKEDGRDLLDMEPAGKHPLAHNLEGVLGIAGYYNYACYLRGQEKRMELPRFVIDDPNAEILGRYLSDGKPGIGIRKFKDWTSVLVSSPDALSARLLSNLAGANGSFVSADRTGCQLSMRDNFMSIHALRGGSYTFRFPKRGNIHDADSNQLLGKDTDAVTLTLSPGDTRWLILR